MNDSSAFLVNTAFTMDTSYCMHVQEGSTADSMVMAVRVRSVYSPGQWGSEYWCSSFVESSSIGGCAPGTVWPDVTASSSASWPANGYWHDSILNLTRSVPDPGNTTAPTPSPVNVGSGLEGSKTQLPLALIIVLVVLAGLLVGTIAIFAVWLRRSRRARAGDGDGSTSVRDASGEKLSSEAQTAKDLMSGDKAENSRTQDVGGSTYGDTTEWGCDVNIVVQGMREHWLISKDDVMVEEGLVEKGGFGDVRTGWLYNSTKVAVKTCLSSQKDDDDRRSTWLALANEMRLLRRTRHPNIVLFFGITILSGSRIGLILEWVEGMNLKGYTKKCGKRLSLPPDGAPADDHDPGPNHKRKLLMDVCSGMQFLHAQKPPIIHRDLKPANILVELVSTPPRAKITDFGVSVLLEGADVRGRSGTTAYMAPEVIEGKRYDVSADVYSFGCTCCYTFLAMIPERANIKEEVEQALLAADASNEVVAMMKAALEDDPVLRPTFARLRESLEVWNGLKERSTQSLSEVGHLVGSTRSVTKTVESKTKTVMSI